MEKFHASPPNSENTQDGARRANPRAFLRRAGRHAHFKSGRRRSGLGLGPAQARATVRGRTRACGHAPGPIAPVRRPVTINARFLPGTFVRPRPGDYRSVLTRRRLSRTRWQRSQPRTFVIPRHGDRLSMLTRWRRPHAAWLRRYRLLRFAAQCPPLPDGPAAVRRGGLHAQLTGVRLSPADSHGANSRRPAGGRRTRGDLLLPTHRCSPPQRAPPG